MPVKVGILDESSSIGEFDERLVPVEHLDHLARIQLAHDASVGPVQNSGTAELEGEPGVAAGGGDESLRIVEG